MPTGYTAKVADGTITELKPFVLQLARGMGALISMRDDPWDAPIPDKFEVSDYYPNKIAELEHELAKYEGMTPNDAIAEQEAEIDAAHIYGDDYIKNVEEQETRYRNMIAKVQAWEGAPEGIKDFAIDQLYESLKFDCGDYRPKLPEKTHPAVWLANKIASIAADLKRCKESYEVEVAKVESRNAWVKQLKESLDANT